MKCQDDGILSINPIGEGASCSIHGAEESRKKAPLLEGLSKEDFDTDGATVGRWTMDLDAEFKIGEAPKGQFSVPFMK